VSARTDGVPTFWYSWAGTRAQIPERHTSYYELRPYLNRINSPLHLHACVHNYVINRNWNVAGVPLVAERIDALAEPEAKGPMG
jgi:hypothetical protein